MYAIRSYYDRSITDTGSPKASFAWLQPMIEEEKAIIGEDWYPKNLTQKHGNAEEK